MLFAILETSRGLSGRCSLSSKGSRISGMTLTLTMTSYVRAMEAQQHKLEAAVHTMYYRLLAANAWPGPRLVERDGNPLIHDVLAVLGLLESVDDQKTRLDREQPEIEEPQHGSPSGDGSIVESPGEQYQESRNLATTQSQGAHHSRNISNQSLSLVPEEARWFGDIPGLLSRTAASAQSLKAPRNMDLDTLSAASSSGKPATRTANNQQQSQSLPASFVQQQAFMAGQSSQNAKQHLSGLEAVDWDLFDKSTAWWYGEPDDPAEQQIPMATTSSGTQEGPCELDGLWQSSKDKVVPQASTEDDAGMDRELPTHFFKIGW